MRRRAPGALVLALAVVAGCGGGGEKPTADEVQQVTGATLDLTLQCSSSPAGSEALTRDVDVLVREVKEAGDAKFRINGQAVSGDELLKEADGFMVAGDPNCAPSERKRLREGP